MARKATGQIVERERKGGRLFALRFRAYGRREYLTLGFAADGWSRRRAEAELENVLADVRRGIWRPNTAQTVEEPRPEPTFHEFASEWYAGVELGLGERTRVDYQWRLSSHLLPYFARHRLALITVEEVGRYRRHKERERAALERQRADQLALPVEARKRLPRPLSNGSINKTIRLLATVLGQAEEYGYIDRNPAQGRKRLLRE